MTPGQFQDISEEVSGNSPVAPNGDALTQCTPFPTLRALPPGIHVFCDAGTSPSARPSSS